MVEGSLRVVMDTETGLMLSSRAEERYQNPSGPARIVITYAARLLRVGAPMRNGIFELPPGEMVEVRALTLWGAAGMRKQMVGKQAPELAARDLEGRPIRLSAMQGRVVVLAFGASLCEICREQRASLEKVYRKYGGNSFEIIGLSVSEDREAVERYLKESPQSYMGVLTLENELDRQYQVHRFPTYVVVGRDGKVVSVAEWDVAWGELKKALKKEGIELE